MSQVDLFVPLNKAKHDLKRFDCGKEAINTFLRRYAAPNKKANLSATFVLPIPSPGNANQKEQIAAYYTLAHSTVTREEIPTTKSLPRYPVPVIILAQLGVHKDFQGGGNGKKTLISALRKAYSISTVSGGIPSFAVILDVLDQDAMDFYNRFEFFDPFLGQENRLFIDMKSIEQLMP